MSQPKTHIAKATSIQTTTTVKPQLEEHMDFHQVLSDSRMASLTQISSPATEPTCFDPVWWFTLEDQAGKPTSITMKHDEYNEWLKLLPAAKASTSAASAPRVMDRVVIDACTFHNEWGHATCAGIQAATTKFDPKCDSDAMGTAMITGVGTAILTWAIVALAFFVMSSSRRRKSSEGFSQPSEQKDETNVCSSKTVLFLCMLASLASVGSAFGAMHILNEALRSEACYDFDEALVIVIASALAAGIANVIVLQYIHRKHPKHGHQLFTGGKTPEEKPTPQFILLEVPDGANHGVPIRPDESVLSSGMSSQRR
jgi:hypothetical protein